MAAVDDGAAAVVAVRGGFVTVVFGLGDPLPGLAFADLVEAVSVDAF